MRRSLILPHSVVLLAALVVAGCGDDSTGPGDGGPNGPATPPGAAVVIVVPGDAQLAIGQSTTLEAEVRDSSDAVIEGAVVQWSSDNPGAASVNAAGVVTALAEGAATITASSGAASGEAGITVNIVTVCECAVIIDSTNLHLVSRDSASGRFEFELIDGEMPDIDTTSVIVGAQDEGFLRHVRGVERDGNTVVLQTTQAGLANVIENGGFGGSTRVFADGEVDPDAGPQEGQVWWGKASTVYMAEGVTEAQAGSLDLRLNFSGLKLSAKKANSPVEFAFEVKDGALNFGPTMDLGASIGAGGLQEFHAIYTGGLSLTAFSDEAKPLLYSFGVTGKLFKEKAEKVLLIKRKPFLYWAGYVPITGVLIFQVKAVATASASAAVKYTGEFGAGFQLRSGVRYDAGAWSPVFGTTLRWDGGPPPPLEGLSAEVEAKATFTIQPELFLKFYYIAGPFVNIKPTLEAPAKVGFPSFDWSTGINYVTKLEVGGRAEILTKKPTEGVTDSDLLKLSLSRTIPLHRPVILAEIYSRGPLVVTDTTTGDDLDDFYDVELTPAFNVNDAVFGLRHDASADTITGSTVGDRRVFEDVRSGDSHPHRIRLTDVAGNCTVQSTAYDTVAILSNLRIATPGFADYDTARVMIPVKCIPLGGVRVATTTGGPDPDPNGYQLVLTRIDTVGTSRKWFDDSGGGTSPSPIPVAGAITSVASTVRAAVEVPIETAGEVLIDSLIPKNPDPRSRATGEHRFTLEGVRANCAVAHPVAHEKTVLSGDTLFTNFDVRCIELGSVSVRTVTSDPDPVPSEPITYSAKVVREGTLEDSVRAMIEATGDAVVEGRIPLYSASGASGRHLITLDAPHGLPDRCTLASDPSRIVTVLSGETAEVRFDAQCVERLHVRAVTTGAGADPDGYLVAVEPGAAPADTLLRPIGSGETISIAGTTPGPTMIRLTDVSANCAAATDSVSLDVSASDSALVTFSVSCPSAPVRDSVVYVLDEVFVDTPPDRLEAVLGTFAVPQHLPDYGVAVSVDVLRDDLQLDEAFAVGTTGVPDPSFIGDAACPVVPDGSPSGRAWVPVGIGELVAGSHEFVARHGTAFGCYDQTGDLTGANSVHFFGLKLVYWRLP